MSKASGGRLVRETFPVSKGRRGRYMPGASRPHRAAARHLGGARDDHCPSVLLGTRAAGRGQPHGNAKTPRRGGPQDRRGRRGAPGEGRARPAIRKRRNRRFSEVNVYVLEHALAGGRAAAGLREASAFAPRPPGKAVEGLSAYPEASQEVLEEPSRAPSWEVPDVAKPSAPVEGPRAASGDAGKRDAGSSPDFNSSPKWTHGH